MNESESDLNEKQSLEFLNEKVLNVNKSVVNYSEQKDNNEINANVLNFTSQIANIAAQRGRILGLSAQSECFGDDLEDCDEDCDND